MGIATNACEMKSTCISIVIRFLQRNWSFLVLGKKQERPAVGEKQQALLRPLVPQVQRSPDKARFFCTARVKRSRCCFQNRTISFLFCFFFLMLRSELRPHSILPPEGHVSLFAHCLLIFSTVSIPFLGHTVLYRTQMWSGTVPIGFGNSPSPPHRTVNRCGGQKMNMGIQS